MLLHFWQVSVWMQILLLNFVSVLVPNWSFSQLTQILHLDPSVIALNTPKTWWTKFKLAPKYLLQKCCPFIRDAVDSELSENKKKLNSWMGLKDLDFGSGSTILFTEHSGRQPLCLNMVPSTKNQRCKIAVVKISTAKYTCRVWDWQEKKRLKTSWKFWKQHHWTSWRQNQICLFMQPAEKEAEGDLYHSLQLSKRRLLSPLKTQKKTNVVLVYSKHFLNTHWNLFLYIGGPTILVFLTEDEINNLFSKSKN